MVRKSLILIAALVLLVATCNGAHAATMPVYEGNMSSTVVNYFKDISPKIGFKDHYVAFRSGEDEYTLLVGEVEYSGTAFVVVSGAECYQITTTNYNGYRYTQSVTSEDITIPVDTEIVYSDLGHYPELIDMGEKYEALQTFTLCAVVLFALFVRVFSKR